MKKYTFENIREQNILLYEYVRGSQAYGLSLPTSDEDTGGVFIMDYSDVLGISDNKIDQVNDEKNDTVWYEIGKYIELLAKANPNMLESLFIPDHCVKYVHPAFQIIKDNRNTFVTKEAFKSFVGYATSQIQKARGLNKKIVNPIVERKQPLDFCYTFNGYQGTTPIANWLAERGLKQIYCGLNHLPNMNQMYGVFYDYAQHIRMEYKTPEAFLEYYNEQLNTSDKKNMVITYFENFLQEFVDAKSFSDTQELLNTYCSASTIIEAYKALVPKGYHGIVKEAGTSNDVHLDSILKGDYPICHMSYNEDGYQSHCRMYKEYKEWEAKRNPQRYLENLEKDFDRKNMMHCVRLLTMGIEIATTGQVNVDRTNIDREFLLNIRLGNTTYEEIIAYADAKKNELQAAIENCDFLPDKIDMNEVNNILINIRKTFINK
jgi:predicted nucleotidyltransferase